MTRTRNRPSTAPTADDSGSPPHLGGARSASSAQEGSRLGRAGAAAATLGTTAATMGNLTAADADQAPSLIVDVTCLGDTARHLRK